MQQPRGYAIRSKLKITSSPTYKFQGKHIYPKWYMSLRRAWAFSEDASAECERLYRASQRDAQSHVHRQMNEDGEPMLPLPSNMKGTTFYPEAKRKERQRGWLEEMRNWVRAEAAWGGILNKQRRRHQHFSEAQAPPDFSLKSVYPSTPFCVCRVTWSWNILFIYFK